MAGLTPRRAIAVLTEALVVLAATVGVWQCIFVTQERFMGGADALKYFTIQSNLALAILCAVAIARTLCGKPVTRAWGYVRLAGAVSITLTGAVFCFVLAPTFNKDAWGIVNILTHVVVPIASIADLFVSSDARGLPGHRAALWSLLPPLAYVLFAGVGYVCRWSFSGGENYPYFFLNWGSPAGAFGFSKELPFMGCMWWILLLAVLLYGLARLYVALASIGVGSGRS